MFKLWLHHPDTTCTSPSYTWKYIIWLTWYLYLLWNFHKNYADVSCEKILTNWEGHFGMLGILGGHIYISLRCTDTDTHSSVGHFEIGTSTMSFNWGMVILNIYIFFLKFLVRVLGIKRLEMERILSSAYQLRLISFKAYKLC